MNCFTKPNGLCINSNLVADTSRSQCALAHPWSRMTSTRDSELSSSETLNLAEYPAEHIPHEPRPPKPDPVKREHLVSQHLVSLASLPDLMPHFKPASGDFLPIESCLRDAHAPFPTTTSKCLSCAMTLVAPIGCPIGQCLRSIHES